MRGMGLGLRLGNVAASGGSSGTPYSLPNWAFSTAYFPTPLVVVGNNYSTTFTAAAYKQTGAQLYVSLTGSDTTGDGSSGNPYRTASKACQIAATGTNINFVGNTTANPARFVPPLPSELGTKILSFTTVTPFTVLMGNWIPEASITWGAPASGRQTCTLAAGTAAGFVDLTRTDPNVPSPLQQVSLVSTSAAGIATLQSAGHAGVFRSTPSQFGASDSRNLSGLADTDIVVFTTAAATNYIAPSAGGQIYIENFIMVGENLVDQTLGTVVEHNCRHLGADNLVQSTGATQTSCTIILHNVDGVGTGQGAADLFDLNAINIMDGCRGYQCSPNTSDNAQTSHGGVGLIVNCDMRTGGSGVTGRQMRQVVVGNQIAGKVYSVRCGAVTPSSIDAHYKGNTLSGTPSTSDVLLGTFAQTEAMFVYDSELSGKTVTGGGTPFDRSGNKPTVQQTGADFDLSNLATLFKDTAGTQPVTTDGDTVARVNCAAGTGSYMTLQAGTSIYHTNGTLFWFDLAGARWLPIFAAPLAEDTTMMIGIKACSDTSFILLAANLPPAVATYFIDYRGTSNPPLTNCMPFPVSALGGINVDAGSNLTTMTAVKAAACNGAAHVLSHDRMDLGWTSWTQPSLFAGSAGGGNSMDGSFGRILFVYGGTDAEIHASKVATGLKVGKVVP